ncbi:hypothetical protein Tco_1478875, partial [Tanacetum coccineum]
MLIFHLHLACFLQAVLHLHIHLGQCPKKCVDWPSKGCGYMIMNSPDEAVIALSGLWLKFGKLKLRNLICNRCCWDDHFTSAPLRDDGSTSLLLMSNWVGSNTKHTILLEKCLASVISSSLKFVHSHVRNEKVSKQGTDPNLRVAEVMHRPHFDFVETIHQDVFSYVIHLAQFYLSSGLTQTLLRPKMEPSQL